MGRVTNRPPQAQWLRLVRSLLGVTQTEMARLCGMSQATIAKVECGQGKVGPRLRAAVHAVASERRIALPPEPAYIEEATSARDSESAVLLLLADLSARVSRLEGSPAPPRDTRVPPRQ